MPITRFCEILNTFYITCITKIININFQRIDKKLIVTIKKSQLAKEATNQRAEIFQPGNKLDATIIELDIPNRKVSLSVKQAQIDEEKTLIKKFGKDECIEFLLCICH